jgi:hypothetical protein
VDMILDAIYVYCYALQLAHNSADVCEYVIAPIIAKIWKSILCAEDDMGKEVRVSMPHA